MLLEVDLCRGSSTFQNNDVMGRGQSLIALSHHGHQLLDAALVVICRTYPAPNLPSDDDLRRAFAGWLDEDWIHVDRRRNSSRLGL